VFDRGQIVQTDGHEELLAEEGGKYAELWYVKAQYYESEASDSVTA
jgi:ATP-binding cassette subfamily B protein